MIFLNHVPAYREYFLRRVSMTGVPRQCKTEEDSVWAPTTYDSNTLYLSSLFNDFFFLCSLLLSNLFTARSSKLKRFVDGFRLLGLFRQ